MRRAALGLFSTLLLSILMSNPAAASCTVAGDEVSLEVCEDQNGNVVPDQIAAGSPVGGVSYKEPGCNGCMGTSSVQGSFVVEDSSVDVDAKCHGVVGQPQFDCWSIRARFGSPVAHGAAGNFGTGPPDKLCYRLVIGGGDLGGNGLPGVPIIGCVPSP